MRGKWLAWTLVFYTLPVCAQSLHYPDRVMNGFDSLTSQGVVDFNTMDALDRTRRNQVQTRSEATVSKFDLKAPARARNEYNKGIQFLIKNDYENAVSSFLKAISVYADFVAAHNALGCAYFNLKQSDLARQEFARAIALDDHLSSSFLNLGRVELSLGQPMEAQSAFERASSIAPLDDSILTALTYVQFLNHDYAAVVRTAQQAHTHSHPGSAVVHYFSAAALQAQNQMDGTESELQTFLQEDPNSKFAAQARQIIAQIAAQPKTPVANADLPVVSFDAPQNATASTRGEQALQEFREKQEIAEVEAGGAECAACVSPGSGAPRSVESGSVNHSGTSGWALHKTVEEVAVFFTATDHGKSVTDLSQADITLQDDKKPPAAILGFRNESGLPLRLGLLVDTSASITDRFTFEQKAASKFLEQVLTGKDDLAFVAGFSNSVVLAQDFTHDLNQITRRLDQLVPVGGTALWDAVSFAADKLADQHEDRPCARVLVLISDGDDNSSTATLKKAIELAERDEVAVYAVSTRNADPENQEEVAGNHALRLLAEYTGGTAFFPGSAEHLGHGLAEVQEVIRSRYLISYKPALFQHDGRYRTISIAARKSGHKLKVDSRRGYYTRLDASATPPLSTRTLPTD